MKVGQAKLGGLVTLVGFMNFGTLKDLRLGNGIKYKH
jgi:hypothetical protein